MNDRTRKNGGGAARDDRLRAALRANLARRKAQARARSDEPADGFIVSDDSDGQAPDSGDQTDAAATGKED